MDISKCNNNVSNKNSCKETLILVGDVLITLDLVFSVIGGALQSSNQQLSNIFITLGAIFLIISVLLMIFRRSFKK